MSNLSDRLDGIHVDVLANGQVHLHATCDAGEALSDCAERVQALVDTLGLPLEQVVLRVSRTGQAPPDPLDSTAIEDYRAASTAF